MADIYIGNVRDPNALLFREQALTDDNINQVFENLHIFEKILPTIYPIGSIYISVNDTSPAELFGGTWEQIKDRFLLACGDIYPLKDENNENATGGSADAVVVSHQHGMAQIYAGDGGVTWDGQSLQRGYQGEHFYDVSHSTGYTFTNFFGENGAGKNMPPYLTVKVWKRVA